jgi:phage-related protein
MGDRHNHAVTLKGLGNSKIIEIRESDRSGTYRTVYTVELDDFVFVLHAFQKKSKSGIATPKQEIALMKRRLKDAESLYKQLKEEKKL